MLSIARQESNFDPNARSGPGARGLMQLMPATAEVVARRVGVSYAPSLLSDTDYNLRLGGYYLGHLVDDFGGSYVMASAGYNAGPGRPSQWSAFCGDPRGAAADPVNFIECIPFSETRTYVMRTLETMEVYRARLSGGSAPLTLQEDLKRGVWTPGATSPEATPKGPIPYTQLSSTAGGG
jgi:soluble lytic murein transglycosylase